MGGSDAIDLGSARLMLSGSSGYAIWGACERDDSIFYVEPTLNHQDTYPQISYTCGGNLRARVGRVENDAILTDKKDHAQNAIHRFRFATKEEIMYTCL